MRKRGTWEISDIGLLLQVPDFDLRILRPGAENETVRMELSRCKGCAISIGHFSQQTADANIRKRPVLIKRRGQNVLAGGVKRKTRHGSVMSSDDGILRRCGYVPHADRRIGRSRDCHFLIITI